MSTFYEKFVHAINFLNYQQFVVNEIMKIYFVGEL